MVPYRSNSDKENCSPVSSNCVIWQGPDISCINLCKGDSVSDIVYKLATELCTIKDSANISDVDFNCLLDLCGGRPEPEMTIAAVLQLIIDGLCCSINSLGTTTLELTARTSDLYNEPSIYLPECLQYIDPLTGLLITTLPLSQYTIRLAAEICNLRITVNTHTSQIANHELRIQDLENAPGYIPPTVVSPCSFGPITGGVPTEMNTLLEALDSEFCNLVTVLGSNTNINNAAAQQCNLLGSQNALSQPGTMSSLPNWNNTISNMAQSMQNLWITVCDLRAAMYSLKSCCEPDCSAFFLGYVAGTDAGRINVTVTFNSATVIPFGFSNCPLLSTITINDGDGHIYSDTIDLVAESTNPSGVTFDVSTAFLNPALPYTVTVVGCIASTTTSCSKTVSSTLVPTSTSTTACPCYYWGIIVDGADIVNAGENTNPLRDGKVFVDYYMCDSTSITVMEYTESGEQLVGCSCLIPVQYYYKNDIKVIGSSILEIGSVCAP